MLRTSSHIFSDFDRDMSILEVGCNVGVKISMLQKMGFRNLTGVELQDKINSRKQY